MSQEEIYEAQKKISMEDDIESAIISNANDFKEKIMKDVMIFGKGKYNPKIVWEEVDKIVFNLIEDIIDKKVRQFKEHNNENIF